MWTYPQTTSMYMQAVAHGMGYCDSNCVLFDMSSVCDSGHPSAAATARAAPMRGESKRSRTEGIIMGRQVVVVVRASTSSVHPEIPRQHVSHVLAPEKTMCQDKDRHDITQITLHESGYLLVLYPSSRRAPSGMGVRYPDICSRGRVSIGILFVVDVRRCLFRRCLEAV